MHTRRRLLTGLAASPLALSPLALQAQDIIDLEWYHLIPEGDAGTLMRTLRGIGIVEHGQLSTGFEQEEAHSVTDEYNGKTVRLPGFVVPLDFDVAGVTSFILAPFVGACIHVPPPPANQLVLVSSKPYEFTGLFDPVYVTGTFGTAATSTSLAEIGYTMSAQEIIPYEFPQ